MYPPKTEYDWDYLREDHNPGCTWLGARPLDPVQPKAPEDEKEKVKPSNARRQLEKALKSLPELDQVDALGRLVRHDKGEYPQLELAGLRRQLHSRIQTAIEVAAPDWSLVKRFHRAWVCSCLFERDTRKGERS